MHHTATHCNTVQDTATHCNTLQHTATQTTAVQALEANRQPGTKVGMAHKDIKMLVSGYQADELEAAALPGLLNQLFICIYMYGCVYICICIHIHTYMYLYDLHSICINTYVYLHVYIQVYKYIYIFKHIHICVYGARKAYWNAEGVEPWNLSS